MKPTLEIQNISKRFRISHESQPYLSLRDTLVDIWNKKISKEDFWALKDISFNVMPGDTMGIIGKNGAGKSTLLKILSKITPPSTGKIICRGRVASLLEVGTGFHPELSGRENVFMNGSILGMRKAEIIKNFDAIVDFAGVEKFIDTPLKHYSSGMQLRLAFAVAAFLENEILIIDEVLAVGDAEFQKKCLGKMQEVGRSGRTILFVSHNMSAVSSLCKKSVALEKGKIKALGDTSDIIKDYLMFDNGMPSTFKKWNDQPIGNDGVVSLITIKLINEKRENISFVDIREKVGIELEYKIEKVGYKPVPNYHIFAATGEKIFGTVDPDKKLISEIGTYKSTVWVPAYFFNEGTFLVGVALSTLNPVTVHVNDYSAFYFEVVDNLNALTRNEYTGKFDGYLRPLLEWKTEKIV